MAWFVTALLAVACAMFGWLLATSIGQPNAYWYGLPVVIVLFAGAGYASLRQGLALWRRADRLAEDLAKS
jgi:hypothetical protein